MKRKVLRTFKRIWVLNFLRRIFDASKYYNFKYLQITKWGFESNEIANYTYNLKPENLQYLANTLSVITGIDTRSIFKFLNEVDNNKFLKSHIISTTKESSLRKFADLEVRFGRRLGWYAIVRAIKPKVIVETGVDKGLGSVLLCAALLENKKEGFEGRYYGTDIDPTAGYLLNGPYKEIGEILYGDSIESLTKFPESIDLFINDSDHSADYEYREYQTIKDKINSNTIILGDNAHVTNKLAIFSNENNRDFLFFKEAPLNHWYPGAGIGFSFPRKKNQEKKTHLLNSDSTITENN